MYLPSLKYEDIDTGELYSVQIPDKYDNAGYYICTALEKKIVKAGGYKKTYKVRFDMYLWDRVYLPIDFEGFKVRATDKIRVRYALL